MKILSFDIEISDVFDLKPHEDLERYAPFHISVAATSIHGGEEKIWYSQDEEGNPQLNLSQKDAQKLLEYLEQKQKDGLMICAWNGLGFDFKWLGHQAKNMSLAAEIALSSYDPMFQFFNIAGFPVGLAKVAEAMNINQSKLMHGSEAPLKWKNGEHQLVMDYVLGDCQMTNKIIRAIEKAKRIEWITSRGTKSSKPIPTLIQAKKIIKEPSPDQSWMDTPIPKEKFYSWAINP